MHKKIMTKYKIKPLPLATDLETRAILKALTKTSRALGQLRGEAKTIPNEQILISTLGLQESKDSNAIENIITTHDELFRSVVDKKYLNLATKEVQNYAHALNFGFDLIRNNGFLSINNIIEIQNLLAPNKPIRKLPGTTLKNEETQEIIYTPPQNHHEIMDLLSNLESYINNDDLEDIDPLIKMAVIHHQFETIHPFYDGNGRTGRIINILYLVLKGLLDIPVLYLSKYIIKNKRAYYKHLQEVRENDKWEEWIIWLLHGIEVTAEDTIKTIRGINELMLKYKTVIRSEFKFYSHDLINNLFKHPYTKIDFLASELNIHRNTASSYLNQLCEKKLLTKVKIQRSNYYFNAPLYLLLKGDDE
jgi:Fic family protein